MFVNGNALSIFGVMPQKESSQKGGGLSIELPAITMGPDYAARDELLLRGYELLWYPFYRWNRPGGLQCFFPSPAGSAGLLRPVKGDRLAAFVALRLGLTAKFTSLA